MHSLGASGVGWRFTLNMAVTMGDKNPKSKDKNKKSGGGGGGKKAAAASAKAKKK